MEFFINNIYTVILFPLWVFLLVVIGRFFNVIQKKRIIASLTFLSTFYGLIFALGSFLYMVKTPDFVYESSYSFLKIANYSLDFGVYLDNLSVLMLLLVTSISLIVQIYSSNYMRKDKSFPRFFGYLNLFNFSMLGLVLSPNLFQNYVFWELVGVSSYLLIGFWYKKLSASKAAKKAFIMNRIGDLGLLAGTIGISYIMYNYSSVTSLATVPFINLNDIASYLYSFTNDAIFNIICVVLLLGAFAKSAQFPLHTWLADAMEGPTPVSALIHSATMVAAGVYLVARLYPIFTLSEGIMYFIATIGLITALICAYFAITQNDFKRILAYSTNSQLGLMFIALGLGAYSGGIFHLVTHAYFKSMLFLCSGIVIHAVSQQDVRFMGGLRKQLPTTAICYLIGCFSISGILFSGFYSKEMMLSHMIGNNHYFFSAMFLLVSLMTAFYMFRSYFLVFEGVPKGVEEVKSSNLTLNLSVFALALFTLLLGFFTDSFKDFIQYGITVAQNHLANPVFVSLSIGVLGFLLAYLFYNTKVKTIKIPVLYNLSYNRFYIDDFYKIITDKFYKGISNICSLTDKYVVDGFVIFTGLNVRAYSWMFSRMQSGNFQTYLAYGLAFLAIVFASLMTAYNLIVHFGLISGF